MGKKRDRKVREATHKYTPLTAHKLTGKTLIPPLAQLPNMRKSSWKDERLPEMLWAALVVSGLPHDLALGFFRGMARAVGGPYEPNQYTDVTLSGIARLPELQRERIFQLVSSDSQFKVVLRPLLLLEDLPVKEEWAQAIDLCPVPEDWNALKRAVGLTFNHQSQEATDCRWVRVVCRMIACQMAMPPDLAEMFLRYPDVGDMRTVRSVIRATEIGYSMVGATTSEWAESFWRQCWRDTDCEIGLERPAKARTAATSLDTVGEVRAALIRHYFATVETTAVNACHEAVFGIALYSLGLLNEMLAFNCTGSVMARASLRTMLEAYVSLAYLIHRDDSALWQAYRTYGSGQAKLAFLKLDEATSASPQYVSRDDLEALASEDEWQEFTKIELGHWANSDLRKMSDAASVKDQYDLFYSWTSGYIHANWAAVRNCAFTLCLNPLHRLHRVPTPQPFMIQDDVLVDACSMVDKTLELVGKKVPSFTHRVTLSS